MGDKYYGAFKKALLAGYESRGVTSGQLWSFSNS
jgi:hypothetical protein